MVSDQTAFNSTFRSRLLRDRNGMACARRNPNLNFSQPTYQDIPLLSNGRLLLKE